MSRLVRISLMTLALVMGAFGVFLLLERDPVAPSSSPPSQVQQAGSAVSAGRSDGAASYQAFYYDQLSADERTTYDALYEGIGRGERSFDVVIPNTDDIEVALHAILADHPEFFWIDGSCTYQDLALGGTNVELGYTVDEAEVSAIQAQIDAEADDYLASLPAHATTYDKVRAAYEWVIEQTDYGPESAQNQNIQSVFIDHVSVCAGYAKAFQYLLGKVGVPCMYVRGTIAPDNVEHAWNLIDIDGTYTFADVTWGDPTYTRSSGETSTGNLAYDYLCLTTEEMERSGHTPADTVRLPTCDSDAYDYFRLNGLLFDAYDRDEVDEVFRAAFAADETSVALKYASEETYAQALEALRSREMLMGAFRELAAARQGTSSVRYQITYTESLRILKVFW